MLPALAVIATLMSAAPATAGGTTSYTVDANGHFSWAEIKLNNFYATTSSDRRHTVCQEQGRALGLNHQYTNDSCMNDDTYAPQYRNGHDYDQLAAIYNH